MIISILVYLINKRGLNCQNVQGVPLRLGDTLELGRDAPLVEEFGHGRLPADPGHLGHAGDLVKLKGQGLRRARVQSTVRD